MSTPVAATRPQTEHLLVLLYRYVVDHTPAHPALLQAVLVLREAAQHYRRGDVARAFEQGLATFQLLQRARVSQPDLPVP